MLAVEKLGYNNFCRIIVTNFFENLTAYPLNNSPKASYLFTALDKFHSTPIISDRQKAGNSFKYGWSLVHLEIAPFSNR